MRPTLQQLLETMTTLTEVQVFIGLPTAIKNKNTPIYAGPTYECFEELKDMLEYQVDIIKALKKDIFVVYIDK